MIGIRGALSATLALTTCAVGLSGTAGPGPRIAADRLVAERAERAGAALDALDAALEPAVEAARRGAARIVTGAQPPSEAFEAAAEDLLGAESAVREAATAVDRLDEARRARWPGSEPIGAPIATGNLDSIAGQLRATADAGDAFAGLRRDADEVTAALDRALSALADKDLDMAERATGEARSAHDAVAAWQSPPGSLPVWLETTDAMIGAMERIVTATRAGDADAARQAAEAIAGLAEEAATADRALRIAVSEGGNALAATALGRLAGELDAIASARARVDAASSDPRS